LDERVRDRLVDETRGNPMALLELPRGLTATQLASGFGLLGAQAISGRIEESFVRRLKVLPDSGRRLLLLAAAEPIGDPLLLWRAADRLDIEPTAADALEEAGLLAIGDRVAFRHPLVRSAVYGSATARQRRAVHLALAEATDRQTDPDRRAWHLAGAAAGPDEEVAAELERSAGRAPARGGLAAAAAFLHRAVALTADPAVRVERAIVAGEASLHAGLFDVARSLVTTAETGPLDQVQQARVELLRGQIALFSAPGGDALPLLLSAARQLERVDAGLARDTYLDAWGAALYAGRLSDRGTLLEISRAVGSTPRPDGTLRPSDLLLDSLATLVVDDRATAVPFLEEATRTFAAGPVPGPESLRWGWLTVVPTYVLWDEQATRSLCDRQLRTLRDAGALGRLIFDLGTLNLIALRCGDLADAAAATSERDTIVEATGTVLGPSSAMLLAAFRGREAEARALIESARREAIRLGQGIDLQLSEWMLALLCNGLGHYEEAVTAASNDNPEEMFVSAWATLELLEAAARSDRPDVANTALERILAATAVARTDPARGNEARCRALMSEGRIAEGLCREAIERLSHSRLRPELARARLLYGEWLRREGRRVDAPEQLRTAYDQLASIGMEAFAERARRELLATGEKVRKRTPVTRDELTARERQIAQLAGSGLSDPEIATRLFIRPRTVEYHLGKVFRKLDVNSRKELGRALRAPLSSSFPGL
jgi:DNA-binding CsgD family transcriptional regulator